MKKIILAVLAALCTVCLGLAVACTNNSEPKYYILTFQDADGVTYNCEILSGYEVKENATVNFSLSVDSNYEGAPVVQANDDVLNADGEGNYSFKMKGDTTVSVTGLFRLNSYLVTFDKGYMIDDSTRDEYRISFNSEFGDTEEGIAVEAGNTITFTIEVSVYYGDSDFSVLANTTVLPRGENGVYSLTVTGRTNITVTGLEVEESFATREDCGDGTAEHPYQLSRPVDLFHLATLVQGFYRSSFYAAHYELTADIDMKGEQLYVISDSEDSFFAGTLNGNGHTISNYYIADSMIDSETMAPVFYPFLGLFGFVAPSSSGDVPRIYNLNVDNFVMNINASMPVGSIFYAGGIAGVAFGAEIIGCSASGIITADADVNYFGYMGGIVGAQYSAYAGGDMRIYSVIRSCSSDVELTAESGYVYAAGGIAGFVNTNEALTTASILNCYSTGDISGAMYSGGIAGRITPYSTVQNCYSTSDIEARNVIGLNDENIALGYAYAGGIAGYADYESILSDNFFTGSVYAWATADSSGWQFSFAGDIVGGYDKASDDYIEAEPALILNSYKLTSPDNTFIKNTLGWNEGDWKFGEGFPVINRESADVDFIIKVNVGTKTVNGNSAIEVEVTNSYLPMSYWYLLSDNDLDEFVTAGDGTRSYGYFFDEELTKKVPYGFTPMGNITLYAGFANCADVSGVYHLQGLGGSLTLYTDGTLTYNDGAVNWISDYVYNGKVIILRDTILAMLLDDGNGYYSFMAEKEDGVLTIYDNTFFTESSPLLAVAEVENFVYGSYYATGLNITYTFEKNGTGTIYDETGVRPLTLRFTYVITADGVTLTLNGTEYECSVTGGLLVSCMDNAVARVDEFVGVWEKSAGSHKQYTFDGKGNWSYEYFEYVNGEKNVIESDSGTYTYNNDEIIFNGVRASFNSQGYLSIDGVEYYKQNSFAGVWNFFSNRDPVELTLNGISKDGYGTATLDFNEYSPFEEGDIVTYSVRVSAGGDAEITLYLYYTVLGRLTYSALTNTLEGSIYNARTGAVEDGATFYLYDDFRGVWISETSGLEVIEFNGLGNYDVKGNAQHMAVSGSVYVNGVSAGSYTLENSTLTGWFVFRGEKYFVEYDETRDIIKVTPENGGDFTLEGRDDWYGLDLKSAGGDIYSFDGRGNLTNGGTLTVNGTQEYGYKIDGDSVIIDGNPADKIEVVGNDYVLTLNGDTEILYVSTPFVGKWLIAGTDSYLEINEFNASFTAEGTQFGEAVTFTYHPDGNYVTFVISGVTMYINAMEADGVTELAVSTANNTYGDYSVCVKAGAYDEYMGTYQGEGGKFVFDGLGASKFIVGTATLTDGNGNVTNYSYVINSFSMPVLTSVTGVRRLFVPCADDDDGAFTLGSKSYKLVAPDALYSLPAKVYKTANGTIDTSVTYVFDGVSKVYCSDGTEYSYKTELHNETRMEFTLILTGADGVKYVAVLDYSGREWTFGMNKIDELYGVTAYIASEDGEDSLAYSFDGMNGVKDSNGTGYVYAINSHDTANKKYYLTLTDDDGKNYNAVLDYSGEDKIITITQAAD